MSTVEGGLNEASAADRELGVFRRARTRPSYAVPVPDGWQRQDFFPKSNVRRLAPGVTLRWKPYAWRKVDGSFDGVQTRLIRAAAYEGGHLARYFTVVQTRNGTNETMSVERYAVTCDDDSQELGHHAEAAREALERFGDRDWLDPHEAVSELSALFVPPEFLGRKLWKPAMLAMLERLADSAGYEQHICVLQAMPLELVWRQRSLSRAEKPQLPHEARLAKRRMAALQELYQRDLGFTPLLDEWMGRAV